VLRHFIFSLDLTHVFALQRCESKEMSSEIRLGVGQFVEELLVAVSCPHFPVCTILLEYLVHKLLMEVSADATAGRKDNSYTTLCMELVTLVGVKIRPHIYLAEQLSKPCNVSLQPLQSVLLEQGENMSGFWEEYLAENEATGGDKSPATARLPLVKKAKGGKSKAKVAASPSDEIDDDDTASAKAVSKANSVRIYGDIIASFLRTVSSADAENAFAAHSHHIISDSHSLASSTGIELKLSRYICWFG
jgi:hypothetical protein